VRSIARYFGIEPLYEFFPENDVPEYDPVTLDLTGMKQGEIAALFQYNYPVFTDDFRFRMEPENFEKMRSAYQYRKEICIEGLQINTNK
jgi:erythronate-4-phosphate dehydrogenase